MLRWRAYGLLLASALATWNAAGCALLHSLEDDPEGLVPGFDAGAPDVARPADAGVPADSGTGGDSGEDPDGRSDSGGVTDSGTRGDSGVEDPEGRSDSGGAEDAGAAPDACATPDACADAGGQPDACTDPTFCPEPDSGAPADSGTQADSGAAPDAGTLPPPGYVLVPAGMFTMGSPQGELGRGLEEEHEVAVTRPFYMKATEVTQGEWQGVMGNNPASFISCGPSCPVERVNWWEAVAYVNQLSLNEGLGSCYTLSGCSGTPGVWFECASAVFGGLDCPGYRLPTEGEWEYAARAGTVTAFHTGDITVSGCANDRPLDDAGWYCGNASNTTHPVAQKQANAWGLYDMHGNVWEWVHDLSAPYGGGAETDPLGGSSGTQRIHRGGAFDIGAEACRAARRDNNPPQTRVINFGFRPVRSSR